MSSYREDEDILLISGYSTAGIDAEWVSSKEKLQGGVGQQAGRVLGLAPYRMRCWISSTDREEREAGGGSSLCSQCSACCSTCCCLLPCCLLPCCDGATSLSVLLLLHSAGWQVAVVWQ